MYISLEVGNSNISICAFHAEKGRKETIFSSRLTTPKSTTTDQLALSIESILSKHGISKKAVSKAIFSSVVPSLNHNITKLMNLYFDIDIMQASHKHMHDIEIHYQSPSSLGIDRLLCMKAVKTYFQKPCIIIDLGTAITVNVMERADKFIGGLILPGIAVSLDALVENTSQLPTIELSYPRQLLGKSTVQSMQNGIYHLYSMGLENLIETIIKSLFLEKGQKSPLIVATGGLAPYITQKFKKEVFLMPDLSSLGLKVVLDESSEQPSKI